MSGSHSVRFQVAAALLLLLPATAAAQLVTIGDLPPGKTVTVTFRTTVASLTNGLAPAAVSNQGTVSGTNFTDVVTDDPGTGTADDATVTPFDSLTISDRVWNDLNGNGTFDGTPTDAGVDGIDLSLFVDVNGNNILDAGDGAAILTTTTAGGGLYSFAGLLPGSYIVRVDASNFAAAATLDGFASVLGAPDPDNDVNNDDNGVDDAMPEANGIASLAITVAHDAETVVDGTGKLDINDTLDFGFVEGPDIEVTKVESIDPVVAGSGAGNLVYTITAKNNGPVDATGVEVTETLTLPAGVTVDSVVASAGTSVAGSGPYTWTIGNLANGAMATLTVTLTVDATTAVGTDVISDTAAVSALNEIDSNSANDSATEDTSVARQIDIRVEKAGVPDPSIVAGAGGGVDNLVYTVTVTNDGPSNATGVEIDDVLTLPAGVVVSTTTPPSASQGSFTAPDWAVGDLADGASATLTITLDVTSAAAAGATITNVASFDSSGGGETETGAGANSATVNTTVAREIDLEVTKTESADPVTAGSGASNLTYVVTVENLGPSDASGVELSEDLTLPTGVSVVSITPSGTGSFVTTTAPDGTWTVGNLANGASETLTVVLTVAADAAAGTDVVADTAAVNAVNETDTASGNDSATEATSVETEADVEIVAKADGPDPVLAGNQITYTIDYRNNGPSDAQNVTITDPLPAGTSFVSLTKPGVWGSSTPMVGNTGTVTILRTTSPAGETASFTLVVAVDPSVAASTVISNTATTSSDTSDPDASNDAKTTTTLVATEADLAVTKTDDVDPVTPGATLTYTVTVDNAGPSDAVDVVVTETLPAAVSFVSTSGCAEDPAGVPTCTLGTVAAGGSKQYTVQVTVDDPVPAGLTSITNEVEVASATTDPTAGNDTADETTTVEATPDLSIDKDDGGSSTSPGAVLAYTLDFANNGDQDATGVVVTDTVPANTTFNEAASGGPGIWSCADGAPATTVCTHAVAGGLGAGAPSGGNLAGISGQTGGRTTNAGKGGGGGPGSLAAGSVTFAVTVDPGVDPGVVTEIDNTASIADDGANGADPTPGDNTDMETTPLLGEADLAIVLTQSNDKPAGGSVQLYTIEVTNNGPALARDTEATVQLPAWADYLGIVGDGPCAVDPANLVTCDLGDMNAAEVKKTTVGARLDPRSDGDKPVAANVTANVFDDPVPGNDSSDVVTSIVRPQRMAAVEFLDGALPRQVLGITLREGDDSVAVGAYDPVTGDTLGYNVSGLGSRAVAIAGVDDVSAVTGSGLPAADFAVVADGFGALDPVLITVLDADSQDLEATTGLVGAGDLLPVDLATMPSFDGSPAPELAVLIEDRSDGLPKVAVIDAGSMAFLRSLDVAFDPASFPLAIASVGNVGGSMAPDVAVLTRNTVSGATEVKVVDGDSGMLLGDHSFGAGLFPLDMTGPFDGAGPAPEIAILVRDPVSGALEARVFDPLTGAPSATKSYDPTLVPGTLEALDDFGDTPSAELALSGRSGADVKVEIRDAGPAGGLVNSFTVTTPPDSRGPLDLTALPDLGGPPAPEVAVLSFGFSGSVQVDVVDASSGPPALTTFLLP